ncbi:MAG: HIT domain-containing protein [Nanoarchaeota archaeon]
MVDNECVFCSIINNKIASEKVYESQNFIGILDKNQKTENHTLIIPKKHFRNILDMPNTLGTELIEAIKKISLKLIENKKAEGINVIINNEPSAGQLVFHTHIHLIPRKNNDDVRF